MTGFIGAGGGVTAPVIGMNSGGNSAQELQEAWYSRNEPNTSIGRLRDVDILWTRSSFPGQTPGNNGFNGLNSVHQLWEWSGAGSASGCHVRKVITGSVQDSSGNAQVGATVYLFNTATGLLVDTQVSVGAGNYVVGDPNAVACFAVGYEAGSPDTTGATVNTLTGT